jgi:hypothetical protein
MNNTQLPHTSCKVLSHIIFTSTTPLYVRKHHLVPIISICQLLEVMLQEARSTDNIHHAPLASKFETWWQSPSSRGLQKSSLPPTISTYTSRGFSGLEVACWPLVPKFAGSHPAKVIGFLGQKKSSARLPSEGSKAVGPMS